MRVRKGLADLGDGLGDLGVPRGRLLGVLFGGAIERVELSGRVGEGGAQLVNLRVGRMS